MLTAADSLRGVRDPRTKLDDVYTLQLFWAATISDAPAPAEKVLRTWLKDANLSFLMDVIETAANRGNFDGYDHLFRFISSLLRNENYKAKAGRTR